MSEAVAVYCRGNSSETTMATATMVDRTTAISAQRAFKMATNCEKLMDVHSRGSGPAHLAVRRGWREKSPVSAAPITYQRRFHGTDGRSLA